jgi:hypothetical protein
VQLLAVTLESHIEVHCHPFRDKHEEDRNGPVIPASGLDKTLCTTHNLRLLQEITTDADIPPQKASHHSPPDHQKRCWTTRA